MKNLTSGVPFNKVEGQALVQVPKLRSAAHSSPLAISAHPNKSDMLAKENIVHTWLVQPPALNIICPKSLSNQRLISFQLPSTMACHYQQQTLSSCGVAASKQHWEAMMQLQLLQLIRKSQGNHAKNEKIAD